MNPEDLRQLPPLSFEVEDPTPIASDRACAHTRRTVTGLQASLKACKLSDGTELSPAQRQLVMDGLQSLIEEWSQQMRDYERLRAVGLPPKP